MKKPFIVRNEATKSADIFLYGIVGDYWYSDSPVTARNLQYQLSILTGFDRINIHLCGPGGDVHEGLLMCNIIQASKKEIHVYNDGVCCSMMAIILMACVKIERRHAAKASLTMFHSASTFAWGNANYLRDVAEMLDKHDDILADIIADAIGMTIDEVKTKWFDGKDHWITAKEGAELGLFLVEDYEIQPIPEDVTSMELDKIAAFYKSTSNTNNNTDMGLLTTNKFKSISALGKLAVTDRNADHFKAVNDELESEGITGVTLVDDVDLQETITAAEKVPNLEKKVLDLDAEKVTLNQKITDLQQTIKDKQALIDAPAEEINGVITDKNDSTGEKPVVNVFETSFDREVRKAFSK